jgi:lipopolysaccharide export system protein LptA
MHSGILRHRRGKKGWIGLAMAVLLLGILSGAAGAAAEKAKPGSSNPIVVTSDTLEADNKAKVAVFTGNVVAKQVQERGPLFIYCHQLIVYYIDDQEKKSEPAAASEKKSPTQQNKIDKIIATGKVKIVQGEDVATGETATFYNDEQKIVLVGDPKVWQGKNLVKGEEITVWIRENRSLVTSKGSNRVQAVIHQEEKK